MKYPKIQVPGHQTQNAYAAVPAVKRADPVFIKKIGC